LVYGPEQGVQHVTAHSPMLQRSQPPYSAGLALRTAYDDRNSCTYDFRI